MQQDELKELSSCIICSGSNTLYMGVKASLPPLGSENNQDLWDGYDCFSLCHGVQ